MVAGGADVPRNAPCPGGRLGSTAAAACRRRAGRGSGGAASPASATPSCVAFQDHLVTSAAGQPGRAARRTGLLQPALEALSRRTGSDARQQAARGLQPLLPPRKGVLA